MFNALEKAHMRRYSVCTFIRGFRILDHTTGTERPTVYPTRTQALVMCRKLEAKEIARQNAEYFAKKGA